MIMRADQLKELMQIPGVGKSVASDLMRIGITSVRDLQGKDPERLYETSTPWLGKHKTVAYFMFFVVLFILQIQNRKNRIRRN